MYAHTTVGLVCLKIHTEQVMSRLSKYAFGQRIRTLIAGAVGKQSISNSIFVAKRESFTSVSREFRGSFARVSREFRGNFVRVSREFRESFARVSPEFRGKMVELFMT
jgi:hypothetical protein